MKNIVALVKGNDRRSNISRAMGLIQKDILSKINGEKVIVKPNFLQPAVPLSCTHVDALRGILDFLTNLSPESVTVAESSRDSEHFESFSRLGYTDLPKEYDISLVNLQEENNWTDINLLTKDNQESSARISRTLVDCRCRISAAVAKTHDTVTVTASWKNMMGALNSDDKVKMHGCSNHRERSLASEISILPQNLVRLAKIVPPHIAVIDGYICMEGNGPVRGAEKCLEMAIASTDFVAADAVCAKAMGFKPMEISYLYYGNKIGLGVADLDNIEIIGDSIKNVEGKFIPHSNYPVQQTWKDVAPAIPG
jgi:uncharacterized protein (DUF362 family)